MSRWWPESVALRLSAGELPAAAPPLLQVDGAAPGSDGDPRASSALRSFEARLDRAALARGTRVQVWAGHDLARLLMVPAQGVLTPRREREDFARHCFQQTFGPSAAHWNVRVADAPPGRPALACALPDAVEAGVATLLKQRSLVLAALRPLVMEAFNRHAGRFGQAGGSGWLLVGDTRWLTTVRLDSGVPDSVQTQARTRQPLLQLLEREMVLAGLEQRRSTLWHLACADSPEPSESDLRELGNAGWSLHALERLRDTVDARPDGPASAPHGVAEAAR